MCFSEGALLRWVERETKRTTAISGVMHTYPITIQCWFGVDKGWDSLPVEMGQNIHTRGLQACQGQNPDSLGSWLCGESLAMIIKLPKGSMTVPTNRTEKGVNLGRMSAQEPGKCPTFNQCSPPSIPGSWHICGRCKSKRAMTHTSLSKDTTVTAHWHTDIENRDIEV